jgi:dihydroflavonol-4-reductase
MLAPRYFLTGATGLIGSHLARHLLAAGHQVEALKRGTSRLDLVRDIADQIQWVEGDIMDISLLNQCFARADRVVHAAAMVTFQAGQAEAMRRVNVEGTANVVNACLESGVKKLCYVSSVAALGKPGPDGLITEKSVWDAETFPTRYAESKQFGEREAWRGWAEGLATVIVNPSVVLGEGLPDQSTGPLFGYVAKGGQYYAPGLINVVDVLDVARAIHQLCESQVSGERFVLNASDLSYQTFFAQVAAIMGTRVPSRLLSPMLAGVAWRLAQAAALFTGKPPQLTKELAEAAMQKHHYSTQKIEEVLDFRFTPIDQTIGRVGQYYREISFQ